MEDAGNGAAVDAGLNRSVSDDITFTGKRKREGKVKSIVWEHFTKIIAEDGTSEKCRCSYCHKIFTCSSRSGTGHLLRHITGGICAAIKIGIAAPKFDEGIGQPSSTRSKDVASCALDPIPITALEDCSRPQKRIPQTFSLHKGDAWMNELKNCVAKIVELSNGKISVSSLRSLSSDLQIRSAFWRLEEMDELLLGSTNRFDQREGVTHDTEPLNAVWVNEFKSCAAKLVELTDGNISASSLHSLACKSLAFPESATLMSLDESNGTYLGSGNEEFDQGVAETPPSRSMDAIPHPEPQQIKETDGIRRKPALNFHPKEEEAWMNELKSCVAKLAELINDRISSLQSSLPRDPPDYSISAAVRCLDEMDDIPRTSEMYLDAFDAIRDDVEREAFICLPPVARRRWLQRLLHRKDPLRYNANV